MMHNDLLQRIQGTPEDTRFFLRIGGEPVGLVEVVDITGEFPKEIEVDADETLLLDTQPYRPGECAAHRVDGIGRPPVAISVPFRCRAGSVVRGRRRASR
jgi:hypothetical protein